MAKKIVFKGKQQADLEELDVSGPGKDQITVKTEISLMSAGTETIVYNRLFDEGTHWDKWVKYPFTPGYAVVGEVTAVGDEVDEFSIGDRVAARCSHASENVVNRDRCFALPQEMATESAVWFALAKIAFMGTRRAEYFLGDRCVIIGAGPIGQMALRWAFAAGVEKLVVVDRVASRLEHARSGGATQTFDMPIDQCADSIKDACGGEQPDIVMDSTGNARVFASALGLVKKFGRVVVLGDTGSPASQRLTSDVVIRGVTIVGAHDSHVDGTWSAQRIHRLFCCLSRSGRFNLDGLITHRFKPEECSKAYEFASSNQEKTMGIIFDWRQ